MKKESPKSGLITVFMCGDVMTGRGIDQILPYPIDPVIHEPFMRSAKGYVEIAEEVNRPIPKPVEWPYIWGDALKVLERVAPDIRIINLETAVTKSNDYLKKGINYRMNPGNITVLTAAGIDFCSLANNHILDWGYSGLDETIKTLEKARIKYAGAGRNLKEAEAPAVLDVNGKGRVLVFSYGSETSGIPPNWSAMKNRDGVTFLEDFSSETVERIKKTVTEVRQEKDIVVASIHWGGNWGYEIPSEQRRFAHGLIDEAEIDVIHGHSSHHVKGIEIYKGKLILYGCGDFLNDYEGISGHEEFRDDLGLMYFAKINPSTGTLVSLMTAPTRIKNFRVNYASREEAIWLRDVLNQEGKSLGTSAELNDDNTMMLHWN
ncbi:MAG TPA: CapA family protein [Thermodesulfobacteriota bacterium]|nr:CapA family protein [Thermodesulfobacteriota bacterium]